MPETEPNTDRSDAFPVPTVLHSRGHKFSTEFRQRLAYTLVWSALTRAFDHLAGHTPAPAATVCVPLAHACPEQLAAMLFDAVIGRPIGDNSEYTLEAITAHYHREYGVVIALDIATLYLDERIEFQDHTDRRRDALAWCRAHAALRVATQALGRPGVQLISTSLAIPSTRAERDLLAEQLLASGVTEPRCRTALFLLDYLTANTGYLDLIADTPVLISPAEEIKAVLRDTLVRAAEPGDHDWGVCSHPSDVLHEPWFATAVSLLEGPDQHTVHAHRAAILTRATTVTEPLWPDRLNRKALATSMREFVGAVAALADRCDALGDRTVGTPPDLDYPAVRIQADIARLAEQRASLHAVLAHPDLLEVERIHLAHILAGADLGEPAPELILVGEHHKRDADRSRDSVTAFETDPLFGQRLATVLVLHGLEIERPLGPNADALSEAVDALDSHLYRLCGGGRLTDTDLARYTASLDVLNATLETDLPPAARADISLLLRTSIQTTHLRGLARRRRREDRSIRLTEPAEFLAATTCLEDSTYPHGGTRPEQQRPQTAVTGHCPTCPATPAHGTKERT